MINLDSATCAIPNCDFKIATAYGDFALCRDHSDELRQWQRDVLDEISVQEGFPVPIEPEEVDLAPDHVGAEWVLHFHHDGKTILRMCSYCGSAHPDDFLVAYKAGKVQSTTKKYKWYINDHTKFYSDHLTAETIAKMEEYRQQFVHHSH
jgi:hypothetical protein